MIAIYLMPVYIICNIYIVKWLIHWLGAFHQSLTSKRIKIIVILIYSFFASSLLVGFLLPPSDIDRNITIIGNYWMGVVEYIILTVALADLIRIIVLKTNHIDLKQFNSRKIFILSGFLCIFIVSGISLYGVIHAKDIKTTYYNVTVTKKTTKIRHLKIALVSDLHLGYNIGYHQINNMVNIINKNHADVVIIAGDIFDNEYDAIKQPGEIINKLKTIKSKYGVFATYGNHDVEEKILAGFTFSDDKKTENNLKMNQMLENADIFLLQDNFVLLDNDIYLYGRKDYHKCGIKKNSRKTVSQITKEIDTQKPTIIIDHEPYELKDLSNHNIDLDLSGHTHNGQMFPGNLIIKLFWENPYGLEKINHMSSIVTSGVGLYGADMRVGTNAEVAIINVNFSKKNKSL